DPTLDHVIEVSDTEITVREFRRFRPQFAFHPGTSPDDSCPINAISFHDAADFCNRLSELEGHPQVEACYRRTSTKELTYEPVARHRDRGGFRLPTNREFAAFSSAGTRTRRYFGDSDTLLNRYAWTILTSNGRAHPVAGKLPNDLGLFDTLGNIQEWCEGTIPLASADLTAGDLRGGFYSSSPPSEVDR